MNKIIVGGIALAVVAKFGIDAWLKNSQKSDTKDIKARKNELEEQYGLGDRGEKEEAKNKPNELSEAISAQLS